MKDLCTRKTGTEKTEETPPVVWGESPVLTVIKALRYAELLQKYSAQILGTKLPEPPEATHD